MPRSRPKSQDAKQDTKLEESPLEILRKKVFKYLNSRLGWPVAAVVVAAVGVWVGWEAVSKVPGIDWALMKGHELLPVPKARGDRFSIVIPRLENDPEGIHRRLISDALRSQFSKDEVEVLLMERSIPIEQSARPQEEVRKGHDVARDLLRAAKGNVMIWGEALDAKPDAPLRLHWTLNSDVAVEKTTDKYRLSSENFDLPELFISDLHAVLSLLVISKLNASSADPPTDENIRQHGIILGVKYLLDSRDMSESQKAVLQLILADALLSYGTQESLEQALSEYQAVLKEYPRNRSWLDWAMVQTNGDALRFLGERGGNHAHLNQAVATYQEDQKKLTGYMLPLGWMVTQLKVGGTLEALASLQSDPARKEYLAQAIAIYQDILKVLPHDQLLLKLYAYIQTRRASAFGDLGEPGDEVQTLKGVVAIYRETLQVVTRERDPMDWARTQYALGGTLQYWGKLEGGTEYLTESVTAFQEALKVATPGGDPDSTSLRIEMSRVLLTLGSREEGTEHLGQAVSTLRELTKTVTRAKDPENWRTFQNNLSIALRSLGERESGTEHLEEALAIIKEVITADSLVHMHSVNEYELLGDTLLALGRRESGTEHLTQAVATYRKELENAHGDTFPAEDARMRNSFGIALWALGERESGTEHLTQAVAAFRDTLKARPRERVPLEWAQTELYLGGALVDLGERERGTEHLTQAVSAYQEALKEYTQEHSPHDHDVATRELELAKRALLKRKALAGA